MRWRRREFLTWLMGASVLAGLPEEKALAARTSWSQTAYLSNASALATAVPLTIAAWFNPSSVASFQCITAISNTSANTYFALAIRGSGGGSTLSIFSQLAGVADFAQSSISPTTNKWNSGVGAMTGSGQTVWLNGGNSGTNGTTNTLSGLSLTSIGMLNTNSAGAGSTFTGPIGEVGYWSAGLSATEASAYNAGVPPNMIRRGSLIAYWPVYGALSPEPDESGGGHPMTLTGSPTASFAPPVSRFPPIIKQGRFEHHGRPPLLRPQEALDWLYQHRRELAHDLRVAA